VGTVLNDQDSPNELANLEKRQRNAILENLCSTGASIRQYSIDDRLQFDLRYNFGLTDILKDEATNVSRDCVVLSAGIRF